MAVVIPLCKAPFSDWNSVNSTSGHITSGHITYAVQDHVATITIDRPAKRNAVTYAMLGELINAFSRAGSDDEARVVIFTGVPGAFCAGTDLADLATVPGETRGLRGESSEHGVWWPAVACPKPVIVRRSMALPLVWVLSMHGSSPMSQKLIKELLYAGLGRDVETHMSAHTTALAASFRSNDHREGVAAFLERRTANFSGD